jgi:hypothetical protein
MFLIFAGVPGCIVRFPTKYDWLQPTAAVIKCYGFRISRTGREGALCCLLGRSIQLASEESMQLRKSVWNAALGFVATLALITIPAQAGQVGTIFVCYTCSDTGNPIVDAALANNPGVAADGIMFIFNNTSSFAITGGIFSVTGASPADSFTLPSIAANSTFILVPGVTSDGGSHPAGGLFALTGVMDTSDGADGVTDASVFKFTGLNNGLAVTSTTAGTSTGTPGTFTAGDPGLFMPYRDNPSNGSTSFLGLGPNGDGPCFNCYYGEVATLNTPTTTGTPEPQTLSLMLGGMVSLLWLGRRPAKKQS